MSKEVSNKFSINPNNKADTIIKDIVESLKNYNKNDQIITQLAKDLDECANENSLFRYEYALKILSELGIDIDKNIKNKNYRIRPTSETEVKVILYFLEQNLKIDEIIEDIIKK
ncbi:MAG: hypothetical protein ACP5LH_02795, partial [Candidatus Micrarchaeia archaeon]